MNFQVTVEVIDLDDNIILKLHYFVLNGKCIGYI